MTTVPPSDTNDAALQAQLGAAHSLGIEGRVRLAAELSEDARRIAIEGMRQRHPELTEEEARRAVLRAILGEPLASRVWGLPPAR